MPPARRDGHPAHVRAARAAAARRAARAPRAPTSARRPRGARSGRRSPTTARTCTWAPTPPAWRGCGGRRPRRCGRSCRPGARPTPEALLARRCWTRCASTPTPRCPRRCARCAPRAAAGRRLQLGRLAARAARRDRARAAARRRGRLGRARRRQARSGHLRARRSARRRGAGAAWHAGDSLEADVAGARAAGIAPVLVARRGEPAPPGVARRSRPLDGLLVPLTSE